MVLAMAAQHNWEVHQVDIKSAYLYVKIKEEIYVRMLLRYLKQGEESKVLRLKRSLPGLKQAGYEWVEELTAVFHKLGFMCSQVDQAIYFKRTDDEHTIITVSVDDMAVTSHYLYHIKSFKSQLQEHFEITDLGVGKQL